MARVFADTVYWFALLNPRDALHRKAFEASHNFDAGQLVTSEMVFAELLNSVSAAGQDRRNAAATAIASFLPQTPQLFDSAFKRYQQSPDKSWSLTDCASFVIMEEQQLTSALTHDQHFVQAGFQALLR